MIEPIDLVRWGAFVGATTSAIVNLRVFYIRRAGFYVLVSVFSFVVASILLGRSTGVVAVDSDTILGPWLGAITVSFALLTGHAYISLRH